MAQKAETVFKERVLPLLKQLPRSWVTKIQQVAKRGTPDILLCVAGVFVAIELKTDTGVLDKLQRYNLEQIARCGGIAIVLTPSNLVATLDFLHEIAEKAGAYSKEHEVIQ